MFIVIPMTSRLGDIKTYPKKGDAYLPPNADCRLCEHVSEGSTQEMGLVCIALDAGLLIIPQALIKPLSNGYSPQG